MDDPKEPLRSELEARPLTIEEKRRQGSLFGQEMKDAALAAHEESYANRLEAARTIRDRIALERGTVDADAVREVYERKMTVQSWGPWAGALFRDGLYEPTGQFKPSTFATNHGAVIRVWRRKQ